MNATNRVLLQSSKPSLHTNMDCTALVAAIVCRQVSVVRLLLEVINSKWITSYQLDASQVNHLTSFNYTLSK